MKSIKMQRRLWLTLLLAVCLCLTFAASAMAAQTTTTTLTDADYVRSYIQQYYIFDYDKSILKTNDVNKMVAGLNDKYAKYYTADELAEFMHEFNESGYGLGISYGLESSGKGILVSSVMLDSAAAGAGLQAGDIITEVNGTSIANKTLDEIQLLFPTADDVTVNLKYLRDGESHSLSLVTAAYTVTPTYGILSDHIGYISIGIFNERLPEYVAKIVKEFKAAGVTSLILDLSNSPGGDVQVMSDVLDMFIPFGKTAFLDMANGKFETYWTDDQDYWNIPMAVIVNDNTWSAAEIFATTMQDVGVPVIGCKTGGKGVAQSLFMLPDGSMVKFTTARSYSRDGQDIYTQKGVLPSIYINDEEKAADLAINMLLNKTSKVTYQGKIGSKDIAFLDENLGKTVTMVKAPKVINSQIYISLRDAAAIAGYNVTVKNGAIIMQGYDDKIIINPKTNMVKTDGKINHENLVKDGQTTMVSQSFIKKYFGLFIEKYTDIGNIIIKNYE